MKIDVKKGDVVVITEQVDNRVRSMFVDLGFENRILREKNKELEEAIRKNVVPKNILIAADKAQEAINNLMHLLKGGNND